jgi:hypothetical protein
MLTRMRRLALVAFALLACGRSNSAPVPAPSHGSDVVPKGNPPMTSSTYHVRSDADLDLPLLTALGAAEKAKAGTFTVELAAGSYKHLQLESDDLAIVVEAAGTVTFSESITIRARAVELRGVTIANAKPAASALVIAATEKAELANIALVTAQSSSSAAEGDPLIDLIARKKGATATLDRVWIVDCQASTLLRIPANGPGRWSSVTISGIVFAANRAKRGLAIAGMDPDGKGVAIDNAFVAETQLGEAWLQLATARPVTVTHSTLAVSELAEGETKPKVSDSETVKAPAKLDGKAFIDAAKGGTIDRTKLRGLLR